MGAPHGPAVGAELGELYKKAKNELADVAMQFNQARREMINLAPSTLMTRHYELGVGFETGPAPEFLEASGMLQDYMQQMEDMLFEIRANVIKTVRDMADIDTATENAFKAAGGEL